MQFSIVKKWFHRKINNFLVRRHNWVSTALLFSNIVHSGWEFYHCAIKRKLLLFFAITSVCQGIHETTGNANKCTVARNRKCLLQYLWNNITSVNRMHPEITSIIADFLKQNFENFLCLHLNILEYSLSMAVYIFLYFTLPAYYISQRLHLRGIPRYMISNWCMITTLQFLVKFKSKLGRLTQYLYIIGYI